MPKDFKAGTIVKLKPVDDPCWREADKIDQVYWTNCNKYKSRFVVLGLAEKARILDCVSVIGYGHKHKSKFPVSCLIKIGRI